jgi:UDP-N-acetylmuramoyl-L-alanyl-D-glutamate--2,6-diaminopimelate ligase
MANVLQAITAANAVTSLSRTLGAALEHCPGLPGRLEPVLIGDQQDRAPLPAVLVDYAHTHDALENVLTALRPICQGKLVVLFGCGGDRDRTKRPKMAKAACTLADQVYITSDNPRTEDAQQIIREILEGVPAGRASVVTVEPDRAKAIVLAIDAAGPRDVVILAGKGHEDYQIIGKTKRHFDDRLQAAAALEQRRKAIAPSVRC